MFQQLSIQFCFFFLLLTELCAMKFCQDGIQVYFPTELPSHNDEHSGTMPGSSKVIYFYGKYELQPNYVNDRPYFRKGTSNAYDIQYGLWWDGQYGWWIGLDKWKGQPIGWAYVYKDVFCPSELAELGWNIWSEKIQEWLSGEYYLRLFITCKCNFIQIKHSLNFMLIDR